MSIYFTAEDSLPFMIWSCFNLPYVNHTDNHNCSQTSILVKYEPETPTLGKGNHRKPYIQPKGHVHLLPSVTQHCIQKQSSIKQPPYTKAALTSFIQK